jgi:methylated-DNA-[protein]-cysteine S-methyltransferase
MKALGFAVFGTELGPCGIAWSADGIVGVQLPESAEAKTRARLARRFPDAAEGEPPRAVQEAIGRIVALFGGEASDLSTVPLDMKDVPEFHRRVYEVARTIPSGRTLTYGDIARRLGDPAMARDVGQALGKNPYPIVVPCHRVLAAGGKLGGFSANGGIRTKRRMLEIENARAGDGPDLFDFASPAAKG